MVPGTYEDFSSQNIVNSNNLKSPVSILINMAFESFKAEQQFYLQIGMPSEFCQSAEQTTELLKNSINFKKYQDELCLRVFGASHEEYKFLKYFYDSNFIKALSAQNPGSDLLKSLSRDLLSYYRAMGTAEDGNNTSDIDFDFEDFKNFLKEYINSSKTLRLRLQDFKTSKLINPRLIDYLIRHGTDKKQAVEMVNKGKFKDLWKLIYNYIKELSSNSQNNRGYNVLKLAQIQFIDDDHTFKDQFEIFIKNVINFIGDQLNTEEMPADLEADIKDQLINGVTYAVATKNTNIEVNGKTYKTKSSGGYTQLSGEDKEILQLTYAQIIELSKDRPFFLKDIKLQGDNKIIQTIFTDKIKNQIRELNDGYDINFELNDDELTISNDRLYMDKNMFFNNMMKLKFDYFKYISKDYAKNNDKNFQADKETMSKIFYNTLKGTLQNNLVVKDNQADVIGSFDTWWWSKGEKGFLKMLDNNPTQIYEIASKSTEANVAGMLGETLMGLFLSNIQIPNSIVKVLGQSDHGNGQAAVDLKIMFPDNEGSIKTAGFQIKQYAASESGNKVDLYSDTSLKLSDEHMRRYLEATYLEKIRAIFFKKSYGSYWLNAKEGERSGGIKDSSIEETKNILNAHLMYFMRYDEAQMKNGTFNELEQNNFYIVNFRFIPASSLLILAALAINDQMEEEITSTKDFFFFSETVKHVHKQNNMMSSLIRYIKLPEVQKASKSGNLCEYMIDDFRLNFNGFSVNFKQQLDSVLKNAK